jgi:hypothetical protein
MLLSLVYLAVRRLLRLLTRGSEGEEVARESEILVLRHQLRVLARGRRMSLRRRDRLLPAAADSLLPKAAAANRGDGAVARVDRFGGLIHECHRIAA